MTGGIGKDSIMVVIDPIPVELSLEEVMRSVRTGRIKDVEGAMASALGMCRQLIEPKGIFAPLRVLTIEKERIQLEDGHAFESIVLADVLESGQQVVPYVITLGPKLEEQASKLGKVDLLRSWILERVGDHALGKAASHISSLASELLGGAISSFSPGTGTGQLFKIEQQKVLFRILNPERNIGVYLLPSYLMVPRKSISGIYAKAPREYVACQYCPRGNCDNRRKPFAGEYVPIRCINKGL